MFKKSHQKKEKMTQMCLFRGDITTLKCEAIVNAANESGLGCSIPNHCIDSAIHAAAGPLLKLECMKLGGVPTGVAKITKAYNLPSKFIIHVTGPRHNSGISLNFKMLSACYEACLDLAKSRGIEEIAFPCISTGLFGYPKDESCQTALRTVFKWVRNSPNCFKKIVFVVFDDQNAEIYAKQFLLLGAK